MRFFPALLILGTVFAIRVEAQDTLPSFSAVMKTNGKVIVSWRNNYSQVNQLSIQRSTDSLRNFTTLLTVPDPSVPENGFVDSKAQGKKYYYRLFILFGNSKYFFTKSHKPDSEQAGPPTAILPVKPTEESEKPAEKPVSTSKVPEKKPVKTAEKPATKGPETAVKNPPPVKSAAEPPAEQPEIVLPKIENQRIVYLEDNFKRKTPDTRGPSRIKATPTIQVEKTIYVKRHDSLIGKIAGNAIRRFSDSLVSKTRDTLLFVNADTVLIRPYVPPAAAEPKDAYRVSQYVFTARDGNVTLSFADFEKKNYRVKFFESDDNEPIFEVKEVLDSTLTIDKASFGHAGWFRFELYNGDKLIEKNKLLIKRDF